MMVELVRHDGGGGGGGLNFCSDYAVGESGQVENRPNRSLCSVLIVHLLEFSLVASLFQLIQLEQLRIASVLHMTLFTTCVIGI